MRVISASGDYELRLTQEISDRLGSLMRAFLADTDCRIAAVIERSGAVLVSEVNEAVSGRVPRTDSLGVLSAGLFGATQMLASQLGEGESPEVVCHGSELHMFLAPITSDFAILAAFPDRVSVAIVRMEAKKVAEQIRVDLVEVVEDRGETPPGSAAAGGPVMVDGDPENPFLRYN
ncbi:MAG: hypothetical protein AAF191_03505 [Verrucomicrobiota bacterium]